MGANIKNTSLIQHNYPVCLKDRRQAMGNNQRRPVFLQLVQSPLNELFALRV